MVREAVILSRKTMIKMFATNHVSYEVLDKAKQTIDEKVKGMRSIFLSFRN